MADQPKPGGELIIRHFEKQFNRRHARVTRRLKLAGAIEMDKELPHVDVDGELHGDQLLMPMRLASARPCGLIRMGEMIK